MLEALLTKSCLLANLLVWAPMPASDLGSGHALLPDLGLRSEPPAKIALLVGIDRYAPGTSTSFAKLQGCVQDVRMVEALLLERFGFPREEVFVLTDEQATHEGIVRAFRERLIERAGLETEVLFWFSGHGSRVPDRSGASAAEIDGKDSTFLAYDSRANGEDGAFDLADDELRSLLAALERKTSRVTVVTDACHSGGATRGARNPIRPRFRSAGEGARPVDRERLLASFWPKDVPLLDDDDSQMRASSPIVHIAACAPTQLAQEVDIEGSGPHGALTYYLVDRLREAQPGTSYRRIADDVAVRVSTACPPQTVWAEGALSRELFGARFQPGPVGYRARAETVATTAGHRYDVRVEAGRIQGLRVGSVLSLHAGDELIGRAEVSQASGATSIARWLDPLPAEAPTGALRAIEETRPAGQDPLALRVDDPKVARALARSERVRIVADGAQADYALVAERSGKLTLLGPGGVRLWIEKEELSLEDGSLAARLEIEFREELRYRALVGLAAEKGSLRVAGRFASPEPAEIERYRTPRYRRCTDASPRIDSRDGAAPVGQVFRALGTTAPDEELSLAMLVVENRDSRPIHVAVLSVSEDRQRNPIWPQEGERDRVLGPGETVRVPVNVVLNSGWDADRPMRDRYLVLATLQPADFTPLARERVTRGDAKTPGMPAILALALERPQTRGVPRASTDRAGYGLDVVDLFVDPIPK